MWRRFSARLSIGCGDAGCGDGCCGVDCSTRPQVEDLLKAHPEIARCSRLVCGYAAWRIPGSGGKDMVQVVGLDFESPPAIGLAIDHPDPGSLLRPDGHVLIARKDRDKLGIEQKHMAGPDDHPNEMAVKAARILAALQETRQREQTIVIFTSDHGLAVGSHGLRGKQNMYEHTIGVTESGCDIFTLSPAGLDRPPVRA